MATLRKRAGCLGQLILVAVFLAALAMGVAAITNPWIFTVGGHFRLLPEWTGAGQIEGPGGTYRIFVSFYPSRGGSRILPSTSVRGGGFICTPSGRNYQVKLTGGAPFLGGLKLLLADVTTVGHEPAPGARDVGAIGAQDHVSCIWDVVAIGSHL
jgi:hypothetical protein